MGIGPIAAIPKVLAQTGLTKEDVDVWEASNLVYLHDCRMLIVTRSTRHLLPSLLTAWSNSTFLSKGSIPSW